LFLIKLSLSLSLSLRAQRRRRRRRRRRIYSYSMIQRARQLAAGMGRQTEIRNRALIGCAVVGGVSGGRVARRC
jgi:hypothetical protein